MKASHLNFGILEVDELRLELLQRLTEVVKEQPLDELVLLDVDEEVQRAQLGADADVGHVVADLALQVALRLHRKSPLLLQDLAALATHDVGGEDEMLAAGDALAAALAALLRLPLRREQVDVGELNLDDVKQTDVRVWI